MAARLCVGFGEHTDGAAHALAHQGRC